MDFSRLFFGRNPFHKVQHEVTHIAKKLLKKLSIIKVKNLNVDSIKIIDLIFFKLRYFVYS